MEGRLMNRGSITPEGKTVMELGIKKEQGEPITIQATAEKRERGKQKIEAWSEEEQMYVLECKEKGN